MEGAAPVFITMGIFVFLAILGVPIAYAMGTAGIVNLFLVLQYQVEISAVSLYVLEGMAKWGLIAAVLFILCGQLMTLTRITDILIDFVNIFVGRIRGGLSHIVVVVNLILAGMSGSAVADAAVVGAIMIPALKKAAYPVGYAAAICAMSGLIGPVFPPSVGLIFYAEVTETSLLGCFLAGAVPGVVMTVVFILVGYFIARRANFPKAEPIPLAKVPKTIAMSLPALMIPVALLVGLRLGYFTPTEGGGVLLFLILAIGLAYRRLDVSMIMPSLRNTVRTIAAIFFVVAFSGVFAFTFNLHQMGPKLVNWVLSVTDNGVVVLLLLNFIMLLLGCFMDAIPIFIIFAPIFMPIAGAYGWSPIQFGIIMQINVCIGLITPPYGLVTLLICKMADIEMGVFFKHAWPFLLALFGILMLVTYVPSVSLFLPHLLGIR